MTNRFIRPRRVRAAAILAAGWIGAAVDAGITVDVFSRAVYTPDTAAMDATLGVAGALIEDFEDTALVAGLTYTLDFPSAGTFSELPSLHDGRSVDGSTDNQWDGVYVLLGNTNNSFPGEGSRVSVVRFDYPAGTESFGVGLSSFQSLGFPDFPITDHNVYVNGQFVGVLEELADGVLVGGRARNVYLRFDADGGAPITSVAFENINQSGSVDLLVFDHVAIGSAPCPADLAEPFGVLDLSDVNAFVNAFTSGDPLADLAAPFGVLDLSDVGAFVQSFVAGCP